jgi:molybdate transport system ATP-binding protein
LNKGEHWAICGANGAGKSTLLSMLYGDLHPAFGGTIERRGMPKGSRIEDWKRRVGFVSPELQADYFLSRNIEEIVVSGRYSSVGLNERMTRSDRALATRWLKFFGIEHLRDRGPREVSYGQMRLALIARAMVNSPQLLLLDEPCTGLDPTMRAHIVDLLDQLARAGTQLVMAVHEPQDIPPSVRHVLQILRGGRTQQLELTSAIRPRKR